MSRGPVLVQCSLSFEFARYSLSRFRAKSCQYWGLREFVGNCWPAQAALDIQIEVRLF